MNEEEKTLLRKWISLVTKMLTEPEPFPAAERAELLALAEKLKGVLA